mgnify:CR=1 FL=1
MLLLAARTGFHRKIPPWISTAGFSGRSEVTRTPDIMLPNVCRCLQPALYRPLWPFPLLRPFLFSTLLPCVFQAKLSPFGMGVGLDSVY